jgi:hypothetical protein
MHRAHLCRRNFVRDIQSRAKGFVYFSRAEQMKRYFSATSAINIEVRRTRETRVPFEQTQWLSILPEGGEETRILFSGKLDHAQLRDHYRPAEYRSDSKKQEDALSGNGSVFESEKQTAGR